MRPWSSSTSSTVEVGDDHWLQQLRGRGSALLAVHETGWSKGRAVVWRVEEMRVRGELLKAEASPQWPGRRGV